MTSNNRWLIAGLGNPGRRYQNTRHNVGFMVVDGLAARHHITLTDTKRDSITGTGAIDDIRVILAKPQQYMNQSGPPVARLAAKTGLPPTNILVIHDDIDIILGKLKIKTKGGHGGHNGLKSIVAALGTGDFPRIRIGIGRPETTAHVTDHVLGRFSPEENRMIRTVLDRAEDAVETILCRGLIEAMNQFHTSGS
jgi:peptidyl-tRNA hydrolase, PTH1 family